MKAEGFIFVGGIACLDFIDTASLGSPARIEALHDFGDLLAWLYEERLVGASECRRGRQRWDAGPTAQRAFARALVLRRTLGETVERILAHRSVPKPAIAAISDVLGRTTGRWELAKTKTGFVLKFRPRFDEPDQFLGPIVESACDLLCNRDWSRLKRCSNPACGLYFYDTTRNHSRRWCSMRTCGNRTKVAAFYRRQRVARSSLTS
jgi:predicted RNA-binding Zn ribbon-like protein